jgi:multidrug efflux pump subunit AcrB
MNTAANNSPEITPPSGKAMQAVVRFTLYQSVFFNLIFVLMIVVGAFALLTMPVERYPLVNFGKVFITVYFPGASPDEVETLVTREIEDAIEGMEDIEFIQSTSFRERSQVVVKFLDDTDYDRLYDELRFRVLTVQKELPAEVDPPAFINIKTSDWLPVVSVNLAGERGNRALSLMAKELKLSLSRIPGVQEVVLHGEYTREFHIWLEPERMRRLGVTFDEVATALDAHNISIPAGNFSDGRSEFVVKVDEKFRSRDQVMQSILRRDADGSFVRLRDVASHAEMGYRDPFVITSVNGRDAVTLSVIKTEDSNALDIKTRVDEIVDATLPSLKVQGVDVVLTQDSTVYINDAMNTLGSNMVVGVLLVSLILWYFMGFRNACLTSVGIPFSFLTTMILMYLTGNSLNEITLFSFVLVSGIIVDDAIVVVENIYRHQQEGEPLLQAIVEGTAEVAFPVISATTTTVAAFLPMLIMTGSTGEFFALIPKAVAFAIVASLIECLFILPLHYKDWGPRSEQAARKQEKDNLLLRMARFFTRYITRFTLRFRLLSLGLVFLAFLASAGVMYVSATGAMPLIRIKFFPDDYNLYYVNVEGPPSTPVERIDDKLREIQDFVMADGPGMADSALGFAGFYVTEDYQQIYGSNYGNVVVTLPPKERQGFRDTDNNDPMQHLENMRLRLVERFEANGFRIRVRAEKGGPPTGKDVTVRVLGADPKAVRELAGEVLRFLRENPKTGPHLLDLEDDQGRPNRVFRFHVREDRAAEYDLTPKQVARLAASVLDGRFVGKYRLPDEEVDLKLSVDPSFLTEPEKSLSIPLLEHEAGPVTLADLCEVKTYTESGHLKRYDGDRAVTIEANLRPEAPTSTTAVVQQVRRFYEGIRDTYHGAAIDFGGEFESTQRSFTSLAYAFLVAVLLMYLILANQFRSYLQPLIILSAVVFSLIGVVVGKLVTQTEFTVNSFVALVGVTGVVVNDALVLIDFINRKYAAGLSRRQAVEEGIRIRLRPILLTTLTTTLGLLPMAIGFPSYSVVWGSMASTFVTGLCTATALTLFIVPVQWELLAGFNERRMRHGEKRRLQAEKA